MSTPTPAMISDVLSLRCGECKRRKAAMDRAREVLKSKPSKVRDAIDASIIDRAIALLTEQLDQ